MHGMHAVRWHGVQRDNGGGARQIILLSGVRVNSVCSPLTNEDPILRNAQHSVYRNYR